jgi:hypothetical protein
MILEFGIADEAARRLDKQSPPQYIIKRLVSKDMFWFNEGLMFPYTAPSIFRGLFYSSRQEEV